MGGFEKLSDRELFDAINLLLAVRHAVDNEMMLASHIEDMKALCDWSKEWLDRLQSDLRDACIDYLGRPITDPDDLVDRNLALSSSANWIPSPIFNVSLTITTCAGAAS